MSASSDSSIATAYKRSDDDGVLRCRDGAYIPSDPANADWLAYVAWRESGGVAAPQTTAFDPSAVAAECQRRIYAVASQNSDQHDRIHRERAGDGAGRRRFQRGSVLGAGDAHRVSFAGQKQAPNFADDSCWPACPDETREFANRF